MRKGRCDINKKTCFTTKSEGLGIAFQPESNVPYAVVMDIGLGAGTVTIFSSNPGDGSMYGGTPGRDRRRKYTKDFDQFCNDSK